MTMNDNDAPRNLRHALEQAEDSLQTLSDKVREDMERKEQAAIDSIRESQPFKLEVDLDQQRE